MVDGRQVLLQAVAGSGVFLFLCGHSACPGRGLDTAVEPGEPPLIPHRWQSSPGEKPHFSSYPALTRGNTQDFRDGRSEEEKCSIWAPVDDDTFAFSINRTDSSRIAFAHRGEVFLSRDQGDTWEKVATSFTEKLPALRVEPHTFAGRSLCVSFAHDESSATKREPGCLAYACSFDDGLSWHELGQLHWYRNRFHGRASAYPLLFTHPSAPETIYAVGSHFCSLGVDVDPGCTGLPAPQTHVVYSEDLGHSWHPEPMFVSLYPSLYLGDPDSIMFCGYEGKARTKCHRCDTRLRCGLDIEMVSLSNEDLFDFSSRAHSQSLSIADVHLQGSNGVVTRTRAGAEQARVVWPSSREAQGHSEGFL